MDQQRQTSSQSFTRRLTISYIMALSIVALFSLMGQSLIQFDLSELSHDSQVLNIAGRQRMLSQGLSKAALAIQIASDSKVRLERAKELEAVVNLWEQSHLALRQGVTTLGLLGVNNTAIIDLFAEIDPNHQAMLKTARQLALTLSQNQVDQAQIAEFVTEILAQEAVFLTGMDRIVSQYEQEAKGRIIQLQILEISLFFMNLIVLFLVGLFIFRPASRQIQRTFDQLSQNEIKARNRENNLKQSSNYQQQNVRALESSAIISRQIATILDVDELLTQIVTSLNHTYEQYQVQIYQVNQETKQAVLRAGSGEIDLQGQTHVVALGQGIIGSAAQSGESLLVNDVSQDHRFMPNPRLLNTASELAVPLQVGDHKILGVLDIQAERVNAFGQNDLVLIQSVADQAAIALSKALQFEQIQTALTELETLNRRLTQGNWQDVVQGIETSGYTFTPSGLAVAPTEWNPTLAKAVHLKHLIQQEETNGDGNWPHGYTSSPEQFSEVAPERDEATSTKPTNMQAAIPLMLRGQIIGAIGIERPGGQKWSQDELVILRSVTDQVTLALESARLARETEQRAAREQIIANLTQSVWSSEDTESILRNAVTELGKILKASKVVLHLSPNIPTQS